MTEKRKTLVTREDVVENSRSEYEALVAIAKEARRLNAAGGVFLKADEKAIPKAVENFVAGRVEYEVDGRPAGDAPEPAPRKASTRKAAKKAAKLAAGKKDRGAK